MANYTIDIALRVDDAAMLWDAAAARAMGISGVGPEDVCDTIGPREDVDVAACLTMILDPSALAGCSVRRFACEPVKPADRGNFPARIAVPLTALLHPADGLRRRRRSTAS